MTKGLSTIPFACRARLTAQGSSSQASMPSVMRMMTLRALLSGKSPAAFSSERAMGVVPRQRTSFIRLRMACALPGAKGTSSLVSSQSCLPGSMRVWCPYRRSANSTLGLVSSEASEPCNTRRATVMRGSFSQKAFMLLLQSTTKRMRVGWDSSRGWV